ncbi:MAG: PA domain-containing protein [Bacteroidota bacterium]
MSTSLWGQFPFLINVDGVEGEFVVINQGEFGDCGQEGVTGEFALSDPLIACEDITADLSGKVAIIDRGDCSFESKALRAQNAGAIAVVICNNVFATATSSGLLNFSGDTAVMEEITVPVFSARREDCAMFRTSLPANGSILPPDFDLTPDEDVIWGNQPGQGDFDGGLNGWSAATISCGGGPSETATWKWDEDGVVDEGALSLGFASGPTFCNGAMVFDSDFLDNEGRIVDAAGNIDNSQVGTGPCPADQLGELISPAIDISGSDAVAVSLEFYQETRQLESRYFIEYSVDGGANFALIEINDEIEPNEFSSEAKKTVPLPGAEGAQQLVIKFTMLANYYYWVIDDVKIVKRAANNITVNENFFATAPNQKVPVSQVDEMFFLADIQNNGAVTQENTNLTISITNDATGSEVFSDVLQYGDITSDSLAENELFEGSFTPPAEVASYTGVYTVSSDQVADDVDPSDNTRTINFEVTEDEFANENGTDLGVITLNTNSELNSWSLGNYFYVPRGNGWKVAKFEMGIGNAQDAVNEIVEVRLYEWDDQVADSDGSGFAEATPDELELLAVGEYQILGNEFADVGVVVDEILNGDGDEVPIMLGDDKHYLVMMAMDRSVGVSATDRLFNSYLAMNLASTQAGQPRYWSFFGDSNDLFGVTFDAQNTFTPLLRMFIEPVSTSTVDLPENNLIEVSPNPAKEFVTIDMAFEKTMEQVNVMVTDVAGRVVLMRDLDNIKTHQMLVDVSNLVGGTFLVNITTPEGSRTEKFIKVD